MFLIWPSVTRNMFRKSSNENYQMYQCRAIIKKMVPCITQYNNLVLCVGHSITLDYLRKRALSQNNIRLQLFLRHGTTNMFNQNMLAKFSCVWKRWRYAWDIAFTTKKRARYFWSQYFKINKDDDISTMLKYKYLALIGTTLKTCWL